MSNISRQSKVRMLKLVTFFVFIVTVTCNCSCNDKDRICNLLKSSDKNDVIKGAYLAGESGDSAFVPLLLKDSWDARMSTDVKFKGFTVYEEKMLALKKIYKKEPLLDITYLPDSAIIVFYIKLSNTYK